MDAVIASNIHALAKEMPELALLYLFGSRAQGTAGPMSDYDLGALFDAAIDDQTRERFRHALVLLLGNESVDLVLLNQAPIELAYAVIAQGIVLYSRDLATRVEYEADVLSRYGDYLPVLRAERDEILRGDVHETRVRRYREALGRTEHALGALGAASHQAEK